MRKIRLLFISTGLGLGGAENMLLKLIPSLNQDQFEVKLISLLGKGAMSEQFTLAGIQLDSFKINKSSPVKSFRLLINTIRDFSPDLIQSWMYHADFITILLKPFLKKDVRIVWGVRNFNIQRGVLKSTTRMIVKCCALFSKWIPSKIVTNAEMTKIVHEDFGYALGKFEVIPNGFDTDLLKVDASLRKQIREECQIADGETLIGLVARFDPIKGHSLFIDAFKVLVDSHPNLKAIFVGGGDLAYQQVIQQKVQALHLEDKIFFIGERADMPAVYNALDLMVLPSFGDSFSNAIGEAMCTAVPCVVSDVGDSANIVADTGVVIKSLDVNGLVDAMEAGLTLIDNKDLKMRAQARIAENYTIKKISTRLQSLYTQVLMI